MNATKKYNFIIIGANTSIAKKIYDEYNSKNNIVLLSRSDLNYDINKNNHLFIKIDLTKNIDNILSLISNTNELIIFDCSCISNAFLDENINMHNLSDLLNGDIINKFNFLNLLIYSKRSFTYVVFNSILSKIPKKGKKYYGIIKYLYIETLYNAWALHKEYFNLYEISINKKIKNTDGWNLIFNEIKKCNIGNYPGGYVKIDYGFNSKILIFIYNISPFIFQLAFYIKNKFNKNY